MDFDKELKQLVQKGGLLKSEGREVEKLLMNNNPEDGVTGGATLWKLTQGITAFAREQEPERCRETARDIGTTYEPGKNQLINSIYSLHNLKNNRFMNTSLEIIRSAGTDYLCYRMEDDTFVAVHNPMLSFTERKTSSKSFRLTNPIGRNFTSIRGRLYGWFRRSIATAGSPLFGTGRYGKSLTRL